MVHIIFTKSTMDMVGPSLHVREDVYVWGHRLIYIYVMYHESLKCVHVIQGVVLLTDSGKKFYLTWLLLGYIPAPFWVNLYCKL